MHQAQVESWGAAPKYISVPSLPPPAEDEIQIRVLATGVHQVVRSRATGRHYTSGTPPHIPGVDGVGENVATGEKVYWFSMEKGCFAEYVNMPKRNVRVLPEGDVDAVQVAGVVNPALSSWMAFKTRVNGPLAEGFSVLILGATSASGRVAVEIARSLGAGKIIGVARNENALKSLGLDESIVMAEKPEETDFSKLGDVDVILDYVYGPLAAHCLASLKSRKPTSYVHIGMLSGQDLVLPGAVIRSKNLTIRGSGPGSWAMHEMAASIDGLLALVVKDIPKQPVKVAKLSEIEKVWDEPVKEGRLVFEP